MEFPKNPLPKQLTQEIWKQLVENGKIQESLKGTENEKDFLPVVKLFTPDANATWLLTEVEPECPEIAFGLCDLGLGFPELGSVSLIELGEIRGSLGLSIERDKSFKATKSLSEYAKDARKKGRIDA